MLILKMCVHFKEPCIYTLGDKLYFETCGLQIEHVGHFDKSLTVLSN